MVLNKQIKVEFFKAPGPGGQHKNKRKTAVKLTHIPTQISAIATKERSQSQNLKAAKKTLEQRLRKLYKKEKQRIVTKPTKSSKETRLKHKKLAAKTKKLRQKVVEFNNS